MIQTIKKTFWSASCIGCNADQLTLKLSGVTCLLLELHDLSLYFLFITCFVLKYSEFFAHTCKLQNLYITRNYFYSIFCQVIWDVGYDFFHFQHTFTKILSARKFLFCLVKLCFDHQTCDHSGLAFSNTSTPFHTFHVQANGVKKT